MKMCFEVQHCAIYPSHRIAIPTWWLSHVSKTKPPATEAWTRFLCLWDRYVIVSCVSRWFSLFHVCSNVFHLASEMKTMS